MTRPRSPKAPSLDLKAALDKARIFYEKEPSRAAPVEIVVAHLGYSPKSGVGSVTLASLRGFGLIEKCSDDEVKLSSLALDIIRDDRPESRERDVAIRRAAFFPKVHDTVFKHFKGVLPSDGTLRYYLRKSLGFTDNGSVDFIKQFRKTLAFVNMANGGKLTGDESTEKEGEPATSKHGLLQPAPDALTPRPSMNQDTITLNGGQVVLQWPAKLSQGDYDDLKDWLVLMGRRAERAVVLNDDDEPESE